MLEERLRWVHMCKFGCMCSLAGCGTHQGESHREGCAARERGFPPGQTNPPFLLCARGLATRSPCCPAGEQQGSQVPETEMVNSLNIAKITKRRLSTVANSKKQLLIYGSSPLPEYAY